MKEQILNIMSDTYEALELIQINDLLEFTTSQELNKLYIKIVLI